MKNAEEYFEFQKERSMLIAYRPYTNTFKHFVSLLKRTRIPYLKLNGLWVAAMQIAMLSQLKDSQEGLREQKALLASASDEKDRAKFAKRILCYTEIIRVLQTIADGIAWRALKFNRPLIRVFSENSSVGHITEGDIKVARKLMSRTKDIVLVNDLTRCLRIADLTQILPGGKPVLYESKRNGAIIKDMGYIFDEMKKHRRGLSRQELRQWVVQFAAIDQKITVPVYSEHGVREEHHATIVSLDFPIYTHHQAVKKLLKQAHRKGYACAVLEDGYFAEVTDFETVFKTGTEAYKQLEVAAQKPNWLKDKSIKKINISNYESFYQKEGEFPRNFTPYSVLPFKASDCVKLMMGHVRLRIFLNLESLKEDFVSAGWQVEMPNDEVSRKHSKSEFWRKPAEQVLLRVSREVAGRMYQTTIPFSLALIMLTSMYKKRFLIDQAEALIPTSNRKPQGSIAINFLAEQKLLR